MPDNDLEQIADQNDFHIPRSGATGAKLGSHINKPRGRLWRLKHLFALSRIKKSSKRRMSNQQNQP